MAGKTVAAQKERALINRRGRHRIHRSRGAELNGCFDVARSRLASRAGFDARLDVPADVVEMKDDRLAELLRQLFVVTHDVVAALQVEDSRRVGEKLCVANDDRKTDAPHLFFGNGFEHHLRADACRIAHRNTDARQASRLARLCSVG